GQYGLSLMWPGKIEQAAYDQYVEAWHRHKDDALRLDGPESEPRVAYNVVLAIAPTEDEAQEIARRGKEGLSDYICFMLPTGDMSLYEARRTLDLFVTEVKPQLDQVTA